MTVVFNAVRIFAATSMSALGLTALSAHDPISTKVTWEREIAPIVQARCVSCHSAGGRAPMALTTYEEARPWARAIREEVLTRRMPKWHGVRGFGDFANDPSLSPFEIALIAAWADGGAPASAARMPGGETPAARATGARQGTPPDRAGRDVTIPCKDGPLPVGRLVAVTPTTAAGATLRLTVVSRDGSEEPLLWVRHFEPAFPQTYWLRNPLALARGARLRVHAPDSLAHCTVLLRLSK